MASPVDVGGLPNHVKYCVSVLSLQWANIKTSPVGIPYNHYLLVEILNFSDIKKEQSKDKFLHRKKKG
jgi:hypothetical protein